MNSLKNGWTEFMLWRKGAKISREVNAGMHQVSVSLFHHCLNCDFSFWKFIVSATELHFLYKLR